MALVVLLTAGLIGGGIAGVSQLVSADRPGLGSTAPDDPDETLPPTDEAESSGEDPGDEPIEGDEEGPDDGSDADRRDGQIVLDLDGDEPIVVDLGDLDEATFDRLHECLGLPAFEFGEFDLGALELGDWQPGQLPPGALDDFFDDLPLDLDELHRDLESRDLGDFGVFEGGPFGGDSVTVAGPDGVSVIDLGENGSVTITKEDGEVTIDTTGDATVQDLDELLGDFGSVFEGAFDEGALDEFLDGLPDFDDERFDEFLEGLPNFDELPTIEPLDPDAVRTCVDEVLGN